jgi:hypothetical protein
MSETGKFGLMFSVVFALVAVWLRETPWALAAFTGLSAGVLAITFVRPSALGGPARLWLKLGALMHHVVSPVVLGVLYAGLIVPTGLLRRWLGGDPLKRNFDPAAASYWTPCEPRRRTLDDFRQQF